MPLPGLPGKSMAPHLIEKAQAVARHEVGHWAISYCLGFKVGGISIVKRRAEVCNEPGGRVRRRCPSSCRNRGRRRRPYSGEARTAPRRCRAVRPRSLIAASFARTRVTLSCPRVTTGFSPSCPPTFSACAGLPYCCSIIRKSGEHVIIGYRLENHVQGDLPPHRHIYHLFGELVEFALDDKVQKLLQFGFDADDARWTAIRIAGLTRLERNPVGIPSGRLAADAPLFFFTPES